MTYTRLSPEIWTARAKKHAALVAPMADAFLRRRAVGGVDAVHDFLFIYYNFSPLKLKQWVPCFEEQLQVNAELLAEYAWFACQYGSLQVGDEALALDRLRFHRQLFYAGTGWKRTRHARQPL
jgi:hypothetical protein